MEKITQRLLTLLCAAVGVLFGKPDGLLGALLALMALDYLTGVLCGISLHRLSSNVSFRGLCRKLLILVLVAVGHILDSRVLQGGNLVRSAVEGFYLANEGLSILENAGKLGIPLPEKLRAILWQLKCDETDEQNKEEKA